MSSNETTNNTSAATSSVDTSLDGLYADDLENVEEESVAPTVPVAAVLPVVSVVPVVTVLPVAPVIAAPLVVPVAPVVPAPPVVPVAAVVPVLPAAPPSAPAPARARVRLVECKKHKRWLPADRFVANMPRPNICLRCNVTYIISLAERDRRSTLKEMQHLNYGIAQGWVRRDATGRYVSNL